MIVYKIKDSKIVGISRKDENYVIKENECQSNTWHQKPFFNGTEVVETITQAEIDEQTETNNKQLAKSKFQERKRKGQEIIDEVLAWMEDKSEHHNVNQANYDSTLNAVENILEPLKSGKRGSFESVALTLNGLKLTGLKEELRLFILSLL